MLFTPWTDLARRQAGVITRAQCRTAGLTDHQIDTLLARRALEPVARGVFRVAGAPTTTDTSAWTAALATNGVIIGSSAASLWNLDVPRSPVVHVAIRRARRAAKAPGATVVRRDLPAEDVTTLRGLPVTTRRRSALDHLAMADGVAAISFAARAVSQGWFDLADVEQRLTGPARGNPRLRRVLQTLRSGADSESELLLHRLLRTAGVSGWTANYPVTVDGRVVARIDLAFVPARLAIEVDGFAYHSEQDRFQHDRSRQNSLVNAGWTVLRFTWEDLNVRPAYVVNVIHTALARAA